MCSAVCVEYPFSWSSNCMRWRSRLKTVDGRALSEGEYFKPALLSFFVVSDDSMDRSVTRRNYIAINDFMLEGAIYFHLKSTSALSGRPSPLALPRRATPPSSSVHISGCGRMRACTRVQIKFQTESGQLVDISTTSADHAGLSKSSLKSRHYKIVFYKTAYYSFYLPCILVPLGEYFQVQDDFLHFGVATDIIDEYERCETRITGGRTRRRRRRSRRCMRKPGIRERYAEYEENADKRIVALIEKISEQPQAKAGEVVLRREVFSHRRV
ncbi:hypothetical protein C8Q77DRAFT_1253008 [Trametes polyzona]|nr:hypothetical protein C8Q77DRAFT_1253008 [Trametes polyzona]